MQGGTTSGISSPSASFGTAPLKFSRIDMSSNTATHDFNHFSRKPHRHHVQVGRPSSLTTVKTYRYRLQRTSNEQMKFEHSATQPSTFSQGMADAPATPRSSPSPFGSRPSLPIPIHIQVDFRRGPVIKVLDRPRRTGRAMRERLTPK